MDANMTFEEYKDQISEAVTTNSGLCPVCAALSVFNGKWKLSIIYELSVYGSMRFSEIKKVIGNITNTALSNALKDLEKDGILVRKQFNEIPPHVEYSLTERKKMEYLLESNSMKFLPMSNIHLQKKERIFSLYFMP